MAETAELREILLHTEVKRPCCAASELLGMRAAGCNIDCVPDKAVSGRVSYLKKKSSGAEPSEYECCKKAFLKGALQISGTASSSESKSPYIEVRFDSLEEAINYKNKAEEFGIRCGVSERRGAFVFYIKNAQGISDFLLLTEAPGIALRFMVAKTEREVTNDINRAMNCDLANISRTAGKYDAEFEAVKKMKECGKLSGLSEPLRRTAELRYENPGATYTEIGELSNPPCSKSTVSNRMKIIMNSFGPKQHKAKK